MTRTLVGRSRPHRRCSATSAASLARRTLVSRRIIKVKSRHRVVIKVSGDSRTPHSRVASSAAQAVSVKCLSYTCVSLSLSHPRAPRRSPCPAPARPRRLPRWARRVISDSGLTVISVSAYRIVSFLVSESSIFFRVAHLLPSRVSASESQALSLPAHSRLPLPERGLYSGRAGPIRVL